jgi:hypothetical protein
LLGKLIDDDYWVFVLVDTNLLSSLSIKLDLEGTDELIGILVVVLNVAFFLSLLCVVANIHWLLVLHVATAIAKISRSWITN